MILLSEFTPDVLAAAPGCPGFIAEKAILGAAIEFAEKSWCLNEEHDPFDLDEGEAEYELDAPAFHRIVGIMNVRVDGEQIDAITEQEISRKYPGWRTTTASLPTLYLKGNTSTIKVYPLPLADVDDTMEARIALAPTRNATRIADRFQDYHFDAIVAGAIVRLLVQPKKAWTDPQSAVIYHEKFTSEIYSARNVVMREIMQRRPDKPGL